MDLSDVDLEIPSITSTGKRKHIVARHRIGKNRRKRYYQLVILTDLYSKQSHKVYLCLHNNIVASRTLTFIM